MIVALLSGSVELLGLLATQFGGLTVTAGWCRRR
jgi:hypothetical protein